MLATQMRCSWGLFTSGLAQHICDVRCYTRLLAAEEAVHRASAGCLALQFIFEPQCHRALRCRAVYKQGPMTTLFMVHSTPVRPGVSKQLFRHALSMSGLGAARTNT